MKKKHPNKHFLVRQERIQDLEYFLSVLIWSYKYQGISNTIHLTHSGPRSKIVERSQEAIQVKNSGKEFQKSSFVSEL